jgi:hypothetical protein
MARVAGVGGLALAKVALSLSTPAMRMIIGRYLGRRQAALR